MARNAYISVRVSWDLKTKLHEAALRNGWSDSQMVQELLSVGLGASPQAAAVDAVVRGIQAQLRAKVGLVTSDLRELLERHIMSDFTPAPASPPPAPVAPAPEPDLPSWDSPPPAGVGKLRRRPGRR